MRREQTQRDALYSASAMLLLLTATPLLAAAAVGGQDRLLLDSEPALRGSAPGEEAVFDSIADDGPDAEKALGDDAAGEAGALLALRVSVGFDGAAIDRPVPVFRSWRGAAPCGGGAQRWDGVACAGGRVVGLSLGRGRAITGELAQPDGMAGTLTELPPSIGELSHLRSLNLSGHDLRAIPPEFAQLAALEALDLFRNDFSEPRAFRALGFLPNLRNLTLAGNHLLDLPRSFCQLRSLRVLELQHTNLARLDHISCLSNLTRLDLSSNDIMALPADVGALRHLEWLNLDSTDLLRLPNSFVQLHQLHELSLCFTGPVELPSQFRGLASQPGREFECVCEAGTYATWMGQISCYDSWSVFNRFPAPATELCAPCPDCMDCSVRGKHRLRPGWALAEDGPQRIGAPVAVFECPDSSSCAGGVNTSCAAGLTGPLCAECDEGYGRESTGACTRCDGATDTTGTADNRRFFLWMVALLAIVMLLRNRLSNAMDFTSDVELLEHRGVLMSCVTLFLCCGQRSFHILESLERAELLEHIKIVAGLFQVLSPMGSVLLLPFHSWMPTLHWLMHVADVLFIDLGDYLRLDCLAFFSDPYFMWLLSVLALPAAFLLAVGIYLALTRDSRTAQNLTYFGLFVIYPFVSEKVFEMLSCRRLGPDESWLETDMGVSCEDAKHADYARLAVAIIVVVIVGVPAVFATALWAETRRNRREFHGTSGALLLSAQDKPRLRGDVQTAQQKSFLEYNFEKLGARYSVVIRSYKPSLIYWEAVDWLRKVFLSGVLLLLHRGTTAQIFVAMALSFSFFGLHAALRPYRSKATNVLKGCIEAAIFLTLSTGLLLRLETRPSANGDPFATSSYEWIAVAGFVLLVPVAFVATSMMTWLESRSQRGSKHRLRMSSFRTGVPATAIDAEPEPEPEPEVAAVAQLWPIRWASDASSATTAASTATIFARSCRDESNLIAQQVLRDSVDRALARGQSFEQFKAEFRPVGGDGELLQVWQEQELERQS